MPNDAKLGLVVGVGLVIAVAVLFFRKDFSPAGAEKETSSIGISAPPPPARGTYRPVKAKPATLEGEPEGSP